MLVDEDAAAYATLHARVRVAIEPVDIVDEILIADVVALQWEVLRWRRFKGGLVRTRGLRKLKFFLSKNLPHDLYRHEFADELITTLQSNVSGQNEAAIRTLARQCAQNERDAVEEVTRLLAGMGLNLDQLRKGVQAKKADELAEEYSRHEADAVNKVNELLAKADVSIASLTAEALDAEFDYIERLDRLATIAENRRNTALRETDRRRAVLGERLRRSVQQIEHDEFEAIERTPVWVCSPDRSRSSSPLKCFSR